MAQEPLKSLRFIRDIIIQLALPLSCDCKARWLGNQLSCVGQTCTDLLRPSVATLRTTKGTAFFNDILAKDLVC
ncbi:hypothetical protein CEXT_244021 [Caerostris extrusa]|uniref:Uncharacterized protein n=1 Tax=Caerostris extrusa TaxID=172846 RepID=A0AAV4PZH8_CAEEX|nr:hypothetical protein CEXT_244021 [Caerostris extrusa]